MTQLIYRCPCPDCVDGYYQDGKFCTTCAADGFIEQVLDDDKVLGRFRVGFGQLSDFTVADVLAVLDREGS